MQKQYHTTLPSLKTLAKQLAAEIRGGEILALIGPLGSGKTTFTKQLASELKVQEPVTSPTFVLMNQYPATTQTGKPVFLYHLDLYRTEDFAEVTALGITEFWGQEDTVTILEWADKITAQLPYHTITIQFA